MHKDIRISHSGSRAYCKAHTRNHVLWDPDVYTIYRTIRYHTMLYRTRMYYTIIQTILAYKDRVRSYVVYGGPSLGVLRSLRLGICQEAHLHRDCRDHSGDGPLPKCAVH